MITTQQWLSFVEELVPSPQVSFILSCSRNIYILTKHYTANFVYLEERLQKNFFFFQMSVLEQVCQSQDMFFKALHDLFCKDLNGLGYNFKTFFIYYSYLK